MDLTTDPGRSNFGGMTLLKLLLVLALIIVGIRRKIFVGYLLLGAGVLLPLLFGHSPAETVTGVGKTLTAISFWRLFGAIVVVTVLGHLLKRMGSLDRLTAAAQQLAGGKRTATALLPAVVGLMPMPGGALLSAPMVGEVLKDEALPGHFLSAANYWFRHIMEFFWPLYPGIILGAGIVGIPVQTYSLLGMVMTVFMISLGYFFFLRRIPKSKGHTNSLPALGHILWAIWPLFLAVFLALGAGVDILIALVVATAAVTLTSSSGWRQIWPVVREAVTLRLFFMVFGILVFKDLLELSGAVADIPREVAFYGIPPVAVIFIVGFLSGLLTGMLVAFVGLSYPILAGFLCQPDINLSNVFLAHLSGYLGMILSPTHFCLLLTAEHFRADLGQVYRTFIVPLILLAAFGFSLYFLGYPWGLITPR